MTHLDLGVGLALMPGLVERLDRVSHLVDCLEVEPQTFWLETGDPVQPFRLVDDEVVEIRNRFGALLAHGVSAPVGGSQIPESAVVDLFADTVALLGARMASEHLSFNTANGPDGRFGSAFFLPPRQTMAGVETACAAIEAVSANLSVPFLVETPVSYLRPRRDEMSDGAFVAEVARRAGCGILLDLHNIWANERNGRQSAREYVAQLPADRVWEIHLAGGFDRRGFWLDAHSGGLHPDLLALAADVLPALPHVRAIVYEILPEFVEQGGQDVLRRDLETVHRVADAARRAVVARRRAQAAHPSSGASGGAASPAVAAGGKGPSPTVWEDTLAALAIGRAVDDAAALAGDLAGDPGVDLLRELVGAGRSGRIGSSLPLTIGLLIAQHGLAAVEDMLAEHAAMTSPALWGSQEGRSFAAWAATLHAGDPLVEAALALDLAALDSVRSGRAARIEIAVDPIELIRAVHSGVVSDGMARGRYAVTVGDDAFSPAAT